MRKLLDSVGGFLALVAGAIGSALARCRSPLWARWGPAVIVTALVLGVVIPSISPDAQHWRPAVVAASAGALAVGFVTMMAENHRARVRRLIVRFALAGGTSSNVHRFALQFGGVGSSGASPGDRQTPV